MENIVEVPQNIKNRVTMCPSNATTGCIPKGNEISISKRWLHTHVHCSIFTTADVWKPAGCPPMSECMKKTWNIIQS
jgi:hypothetical protein